MGFQPIHAGRPLVQGKLASTCLPLSAQRQGYKPAAIACNRGGNTTLAAMPETVLSAGAINGWVLAHPALRRRSAVSPFGLMLQAAPTGK
jgi:hypothetical protein